jgi:hypothetical protein
MRCGITDRDISSGDVASVEASDERGLGMSGSSLAGLAGLLRENGREHEGSRSEVGGSERAKLKAKLREQRERQRAKEEEEEEEEAAQREQEKKRQEALGGKERALRGQERERQQQEKEALERQNATLQAELHRLQSESDSIEAARVLSLQRVRSIQRAEREMHDERARRPQVSLLVQKYLLYQYKSTNTHVLACGSRLLTFLSAAR